MSVKAKSKSKPKRAPKQPAKPRARKHASRPNRPRATPTAMLLFLGGLALMANGVAVTIGPDYVPELSDWARLVQRADVPGAMQLLVGSVLFGLGLIARYQRVHTATLLEPSQAEVSIEEFVAEVADFRLQVQELQHDNIEFRKLIGEVKKEIVDHRQELRTDQSKDALFRLAASLDQLGARIEGRIGEAAAGFQSGFEDITSMVEASRDYLQESLDEVSRRVHALDDADAYDASSHDHGHHQAHHEHHGHDEGHRGYEHSGDGAAPEAQPEAPQQGLQLAAAQPVAPESNDDTIMTVEFEDRARPPVPSSGLGLLDSIDDYGPSESAPAGPQDHAFANAGQGQPTHPGSFGGVDAGEAPDAPLPHPPLELNLDEESTQQSGYGQQQHPHPPGSI